MNRPACFYPLILMTVSIGFIVPATLFAGDRVETTRNYVGETIVGEAVGDVVGDSMGGPTEGRNGYVPATQEAKVEVSKWRDNGDDHASLNELGSKIGGIANFEDYNGIRIGVTGTSDPTEFAMYHNNNLAFRYASPNNVLAFTKDQLSNGIWKFSVPSKDIFAEIYVKK